MSFFVSARVVPGCAPFLDCFSQRWRDKCRICFDDVGKLGKDEAEVENNRGVGYLEEKYSLPGTLSLALTKLLSPAAPPSQCCSPVTGKNKKTQAKPKNQRTNQKKGPQNQTKPKKVAGN